MSTPIVSKDRGESQDSVGVHLFICQKKYKLCKKNRNFFEKPLDIPKDPGYNIARVKKELKGKEKLNKEPESEVSGLCLLFSQKAEKESGRSIPAGERVLQGQDQKSSNILKNERGGSDGTA